MVPPIAHFSQTPDSDHHTSNASSTSAPIHSDQIMRHHLVSPINITIIMPSSTSPSPFHKPKKHQQNPNSTTTTTTTCKQHCPSATLDILVLILVLFSGTFLLTSYFSYLFTSLSLLLPPIDYRTLLHDPPLAYAAAFFLVFVTVFATIECCCGYRKRRCGRKGCNGLKNATEFDLQLQMEECLKEVGVGGRKEKDLIDKLPWKGETELNPDYECLRAELRKLAPVNGRAVLLFREKCGCAVAKLEGWGSKRGRRHKKSLTLKGV